VSTMPRTGPIGPSGGRDNVMWRVLFWLSAVLAVVFLVGGMWALTADLPDGPLINAIPFFIWVALSSLVALYARRRWLAGTRKG
jgi:hypothetical protein